MPASPSSHDRRQVLQRLRARLARETRQDSTGRAEGIGFGLEAVDRTLPGGLGRNGVHELCGPEDAALGLGAVLLGRFAGHGPVVWIRTRGDLYAPGLAGLGLAPERLIVVRTRGRDARLWALEEVLRSVAVSAGLVEIDRLSLTQGRRLQLAAEAGGTAGLLLRPEVALAQPGAARTRWRVGPLARGSPARGGGAPAGRDLNPPGWALELVRCRSGGTGRWRIEWRDGGFHEVLDPLLVAAPPLDRPARAGSA